MIFLLLWLFTKVGFFKFVTSVIGSGDNYVYTSRYWKIWRRDLMVNVKTELSQKGYEKFLKKKRCCIDILHKVAVIQENLFLSSLFSANYTNHHNWVRNYISTNHVFFHITSKKVYFSNKNFILHLLWEWVSNQNMNVHQQPLIERLHLLRLELVSHIGKV